MTRPTSNTIAPVWTKEVVIAAIALAGIGIHLALRCSVKATGTVFGFPPAGLNAS